MLRLLALISAYIVCVASTGGLSWSCLHDALIDTQPTPTGITWTIEYARTISGPYVNGDILKDGHGSGCVGLEFFAGGDPVIIRVKLDATPSNFNLHTISIDTKRAVNVSGPGSQFESLTGNAWKTTTFTYSGLDVSEVLLTVHGNEMCMASLFVEGCLDFDWCPWEAGYCTAGCNVMKTRDCNCSAPPVFVSGHTFSCVGPDTENNIDIDTCDFAVDHSNHIDYIDIRKTTVEEESCSELNPTFVVDENAECHLKNSPNSVCQGVYRQLYRQLFENEDGNPESNYDRLNISITGSATHFISITLKTTKALGITATLFTLSGSEVLTPVVISDPSGETKSTLVRDPPIEITEIVLCFDYPEAGEIIVKDVKIVMCASNN